MKSENTISEVLGIKEELLSKDKVIFTMPVDNRTRQPFGYLHGGASVVLAETAASVGTVLNINPEEEAAFGIEINANHVKSKKDGIVKAIAVPLHKGRTTMVWDIKIVDEENQLICVSRCTVGVVKKKKIGDDSIASNR
jgi:1,4-dihydroxy-2-naphthoyl-CoA hydrolase